MLLHGELSMVSILTTPAATLSINRQQIRTLQVAPPNCWAVHQQCVCVFHTDMSLENSGPPVHSNAWTVRLESKFLTVLDPVSSPLGCPRTYACLQSEHRFEIDTHVTVIAKRGSMQCVSVPILCANFFFSYVRDSFFWKCFLKLHFCLVFFFLKTGFLCCIL